MKTTQLKIVKERLKTKGYVDNFWAIENKILRLGAIIFALRVTKPTIKGAFGKSLGMPKEFHKNFYYFVNKNKVK